MGQKNFRYRPPSHLNSLHTWKPNFSKLITHRQFSKECHFEALNSNIDIDTLQNVRFICIFNVLEAFDTPAFQKKVSKRPQLLLHLKIGAGVINIVPLYLDLTIFLMSYKLVGLIFWTRTIV